MSIDLKPWREQQDRFKKVGILCVNLVVLLFFLLTTLIIRSSLQCWAAQSDRANAFLAVTINKYDKDKDYRRLKELYSKLEEDVKFVLLWRHQQQQFWQKLRLVTTLVPKKMKLTALTVKANQVMLSGKAQAIGAVNQYVTRLSKQKLFGSVKLDDLREMLIKNHLTVGFKILIESKQNVETKKNTSIDKR